MKSGNTLWLIDVIKAVASQLIVWHHLAAYSPMSDVLYPHATSFTDWLYEDARLAVQAFLVIGGFLSARSLAPAPDALLDAFSQRNLVGLLWSRYLRLARPYVVALICAIVCAGLARGLVADPTTPTAPSLGQVLAHLVLLQDIVHVDALSAGVWYVAIDFQLYALLALALWSARRIALRTGTAAGTVVASLLIGLAAASLFWLNRNPALDQWAPYFFGAYSLGVFAQWATATERGDRWLALIALLTVCALALEWRSRILVAGLTALALATGVGAYFSLKGEAARLVAALGRISYPVFLIHYPVSLLVGAMFLRLWPQSLAVSVLGLLAAWLLSLAGGALLHRWVERQR